MSSHDLPPLSVAVAKTRCQLTSSERDALGPHLTPHRAVQTGKKGRKALISAAILGFLVEIQSALSALREEISASNAKILHSISKSLPL